MKRLILALAILAMAGSPSGAQSDIVGVALADDEGTFGIGATKIRLFGIDTLESGQSCRAEGVTWPCGKTAWRVFRDLVHGRELTCRPNGPGTFGWLVATCHLPGGEDIASWMIRRGWGLAYRRFSGDRYVADEDMGRSLRLGIWEGEFVTPWNWRRGKRLATDGPHVPSDCFIKGKIAAGGERTYHVRGQPDYARTIIDTTRNERWFCTEAEARAAGWRKAKR